MNLFEDFVAISRYCRWIPELNRRETWEETVNRFMNYIIDRCGFDGIMRPVIDDMKETILNREVFPSMRALMTAGPALERDDTAAYNCSYVAVNRVEDFRNIMYILMCGTGVGFSCEEEEIDNLPAIPSEIIRDDHHIIKVSDSRAGWADAYSGMLNCLYKGIHPTIDTSEIRPAGARLKTFGGRASGPEPYERLVRFTINMFNKAKGRKLKSIEVHDLVCQIAEVIICGGVRRSALISLSDLSNREMAMAKTGPWWDTASHRSLANNSAVYEHKPELGGFLQEWSALYDSRSGERGIMNREALTMLAKRSGRKTNDIKFGTNPCSEIILRPNQFCNLSTVVIKADDTKDDIARKVEIATILGTIQSSFTRFKFFEDRGDHSFKENCEEERLLGVSMTGILDHPLMSGKENREELKSFLNDLRLMAREVNIVWAGYLDINPSTAVTCIKPEGTTSCVAGSASGMHPRHSQYYIRRVRLDIKDPLTKLMIDQGVPYENCVMRPDSQMVFEFPIKSPAGSVIQSELTAEEHLSIWELYQKFYCDHKPSITISYTDDEFLKIGSWIWDNWEWVSGISFLPATDHVYKQAPFEAIDKAQYETLYNLMPTDINWSLLSEYEKEDETKNSHTLACTANGCEIQ